MNPASSKCTFLRVWDCEFRTTVSVLGSFADAALEAKPDERSRSGRDLACQCVADERVIASVTEKPVHDLRNVPPWPPAPETMWEIAAAYEATHRHAMQKVDSLTEEDFGPTVTSIVNGGDAPSGRVRMEHATVARPLGQRDGPGPPRGQSTIYLRQVGGKVPSIYGPSGDQPVPAY